MKFTNYHDILMYAYDEALNSPDTSSQNGAVLSASPKDVSGGFVYGRNDFYEGIPAQLEDRIIKLQRIEHAERAAIYNAASFGMSTLGGTLFCPWVACHDCARAIIGSGIGKVVHHKQRSELTDPRWQPQVDEAMCWLENAGVEVIAYDGPIEAEPILISGKLWSPETLEYV